jgi:Tetratricopeptide repeat/PEGA domain
MRQARALRFCLKLRRYGPCAAAACVVALGALHATAQPSEADKATARDLATKGIELYRQGKYKDALDRLERAEALYPAPIHLLYIARSEAKLQKLVEAAETYRQLAKWKLDANAPQVFKDAQASGQKELTDLEPKIPALNLDVTPKTATNLSVVIDGEHVPAAVVGVDRVADPGQHHIEVSAPGFETAQATVTVHAGEKKHVALALKASAAGASAPTGAAQGAKQNQPMHVETPAPAREQKPTWYGFMLGLRLGATFPTGDAGKDPTGNKVPMSTLFGHGGSLELHGGVRLWKYFTPVLVFQGTALQGGSMPNAQSASVQSYGLGVIVGTERNHFGGFGELDFMPYEKYQASQSFGVGITSCTETQSLTDAAVRIGGGAVLPISNFLHITPFVMGTLAAFTNDDRSQSGLGCAAHQPTGLLSGSISNGNQTIHGLLFIGVGGDYVFGSDTAK